MSMPSCVSLIAASLVIALAAPVSGAAQPGEPLPQYLYLWTASADESQADFLAVLDVTENEGRYGRLVTTLPVPGRGNGPHHTEHEMPADRMLFANGFASGQTFVFDLREPAQPRIAAQFGDVEGLSHPHTFVRLPNGNVLATFQMRHGHGPDGTRTGGLVEMTPDAKAVRVRSADYPGADAGLRVYSAAVIPSADRIVTTTSDMHASHAASRNLQVWSLTDLALRHTFALPDGPAGNEGQLTAEPRLLDDGKTILVSTFSCGVYLVEGLAGDAPSARLVASFPQKQGEYCAIPVIAGDYYLVTVPAWSAVVSLDIRDPAAPREVSRVTLGADDVPHWIAISPDRRRVVVTGYAGLQHRVMIARFDPGTGTLSWDERFREEGAAEAGFRMDDKYWPHGGDAKGIPHGALFSRP
ncbi:MAG: hypothetical protein ACT4UP_07035 [Gammaproteobacteria bacterium]